MPQIASAAMLIAAIVIALVAVSCADSGGEGPVGAPAVERPTPLVGPGPTVAASTTRAPATAGPALQGLDVEVVARGLDKPVFVDAPAGDERLFIVEQDGLIRILVDGEVAVEPFLDIDSLVGSGNLEQGLLGLAFHPGYGDNGRFFVYYTDNDGNSQVVEYATTSDDPDRADASSAKLIISENQPANNHNAGMLAFGPDGYLYVGLGDGGGANDEFSNGQRPQTLLGAILRLDIDAADPYAVPPENPFLSGGGAKEVWTYGVRNPWRFSFDGDQMYIGDVGQGRREEIDVVGVATAGINLGWPIFEGTSCLGGEGCSAGDLTPPVVEFDHTEGCSVIGGYVYRGAAIPELDGHYFYSDWCGGFLRSFVFAGGTATELRDWTADIGGILGNVTSMGTDGAGEIYLMNGEGFLFKLVAVR